MNLTTSEELSKFLDQYRDLYNADTLEAYNELKILSRDIELPEFYVQKEIRDTYTIDVQPHPEKPFTVKVYDNNKNFVKEFSNLSEPYDWVEKEFDVNIQFTGQLSLTGNGNQDSKPDFVCENNRFLLTFTDQEEKDLAIRAYLGFLFLAEAYYKNPTDFVLSFNWVKAHPAFWTRHEYDPTSWCTNYSTYWFDITQNDGEVVYMLEAGAAVQPERTTHYHDLRLDVYAPSFEDGFIRLAALVDKFFHLNGSEREKVSYIPSELEKTLTRRVEEINNLKKENRDKQSGNEN